jgi:hypothetical protein
MGTFLAAGVLFVHSAFAAPATNNAKPGWGLGDTNHVHTGPPGQSVRPNITTSVNVVANTGGNTVGSNSSVTTGAVNVGVTISNAITNMFGGN